MKNCFTTTLVAANASFRFALCTASFHFFFLFPAFCTAQAVTSIITDYNTFWKSTSATPSAVKPDNSHNLLAFTHNGIQYSTGVNDALLTSHGESFVQGDFWSLPVSSISGSVNGNTKIGLGALYDGVYNGASNPTPEYAIAPYLTDGIKGLNLGTGVANLPSGAMTFSIQSISPASIGDGKPDVLVTQFADPTGNSSDQYEFNDVNGTRIGNYMNVVFNNINPVGNWTGDFYDARNPLTLPGGFTQTDRPIRLWAADLSSFGITAANYQQIRSFKINLCGNSDIAFVGYDNQSVNFVGVLPVKFNFLKAALVNKQVEVKWQTGQELNTDKFFIERSDDGVVFQSVGAIQSQNNSTSKNNYSFTDKIALAKASYYRIKQTDVNGAFSYSPVVKIENKTLVTDLAVYPNPATDQLFVQHGTASGKEKIFVMNISGVQVATQLVKKEMTQTEIDIQSLPNGVYYVVYQKENKRTVSRFVKN